MPRPELPRPRLIYPEPKVKPGTGPAPKKQVGLKAVLDRPVKFDTVTGLNDGGGAVLKNVRLFLVFWGSAWGLHPTPSVEAVSSAVAVLMYGPYMTALDQYHGVSAGVLEGKAVITTVDPPAPFGESDIRDFLLAQFSAGTVPAPTADNQRLYAVIPPSGAKYFDAAYGGAHSYFQHNFLNCPYLWVLNDGKLEDITWEFSHELAEACTDPNLDAIHLTGLTAPGGEIGDACETMTGQVADLVVQPYWSQRDKSCVIPQGQYIGNVIGTPSLIQGRFAAAGNFELVSPLRNGGLAHWSRGNDVPFVPWYGPNAFAQDFSQFDSVSLIQSNFSSGGNIGNLEAVAVFQGRLFHYWREDVPPYTWHGPIWIKGSEVFQAVGNPSLIQGFFGGRGNFELVVPVADGRIAHFSRSNDTAGVPWFGPVFFAAELGSVKAVSLIQSRRWTYGANIGTLDVIALSEGSLFHYIRDDRPPYNWYGPFPLNGVAQQPAVGNPVLIEGRFGNAGNFEVVVPLLRGGIAHYSCANDLPGRPWFGPTVFAIEGGPFDAVACVQSRYSSGAGIGNFDLAARSVAVGQLLFYWRDDTPPYVWNGPCPRPVPV